MAISSSTVYEFQDGGNDTFGGGFDSTIAGAGVDYSQSTSAGGTYTDLTTVGAGATTITTVIGTFPSDCVGNIMFISGSTSGFQVGFYQIITFIDANNVILDRTPSSGAAGVSGDGIFGGCRKLISSNSFAAALVAGNTVWVKVGSYTLASFSSATAGTNANPISILGYNTSRGDNPTGSNRPTLVFGASAFSPGVRWKIMNFISTISQASGWNTNTGDLLENCKVTSTNATSTNGAINSSGNVRARIINCEAINASGIGIITNTEVLVFGCYIHGCTTGISITSKPSLILNNIISGNTTGILIGATLLDSWIMSNTIFGAETPAGTGIDGSAATAPGEFVIENNIIYGFTTGVNWNASIPNNHWDYNDFFNNTTDRTNVTAGPHDVAINPGFTNTAGGDFSITGAI